jgi:hypothetical protein
MDGASLGSSEGAAGGGLISGFFGASGRGSAGATPVKNPELRITVTVRVKGENRLVVRANAELNQRTIADPKQYQDFFAALEKAMFLTAHRVD